MGAFSNLELVCIETLLVSALKKWQCKRNSNSKDNFAVIKTISEQINLCITLK